MTLRLRRSELSTPASSPKMMEKAMATAADMVFLDLEDAVAPAQKEAARKNAVDALRNLDWGKKVRAVRVNGADTHWAHDDVIVAEIKSFDDGGHMGMRFTISALVPIADLDAVCQNLAALDPKVSTSGPWPFPPRPCDLSDEAPDAAKTF